MQTVNLTPFRDVATQTEPFFVAVTTTHDDVTNTQQHDQWNQPAVRVTVKDAMIMLVGAGFFSCTLFTSYNNIRIVRILLHFCDKKMHM